MDEEMQMNPDFQLVMKFLQNIRPGDMDEESSQQLMAIGQRIQGGGALSDKEREMLESVVDATMGLYDPNNPEHTTPLTREQERELRKSVEGIIMDESGSSMTDAERQMAEEDAYFKRLREQQEQMYNMNQMQQEGAAPMTSMRPRMRP